MLKSIAAAVVTVAFLLTPAVAHALPMADPVPGRFCKASDAGKVVKTGKYGKVKCGPKGGRNRWIDLPG